MSHHAHSSRPHNQPSSPPPPPSVAHGDALILQLNGPADAEALLNRHLGLLLSARRLFNVTFATETEQAITHIKRFTPTLIAAIDAGVASPSNRTLQDHIAAAVKGGSSFLMCCNFSRGVTESDFKAMIFNVFNIGWEFGQFHNGAYVLNCHFNTLDSIRHQGIMGIEPEIQMKAIELWNTKVESRLYMDKDLNVRQGPSQGSAAVAFEKLGKGYVGYIGGISNIYPIRSLTLAFMRNALLKLSPPPLLPPQRPIPPHRNPPKSTSLSVARRFYRRERNTGPLNPRGPCDNCGRRDTIYACIKCKAVFYCSGDCQAASVKSHREVCIANRISLESAISLAEEGNTMPLVKELILIQERHEVFERLIDTYRLRIEDLNRISKIQKGCYNQQSRNKLNMEEFIDFLRRMQTSSQIVRPAWWDLESQVNCEDLARNHYLRVYIGRPVTDAQIIAHYDDEKFMPTALRVLGNIFYGATIPDPPAGDGTDESTTEESSPNGAKELDWEDLDRYDHIIDDDDDGVDLEE
ncbi:hypothetical protein DRE_03949 [Drechslerella stenobrocha 248]|uniref:MYND-type domain-containing protein n=1 Tax=Drechslerella stenobrocha 248 TaxID=1043628 RepID=W7HTJ0_9PEZI|nr:hypothetical protein DRE_03949 [Drechslerella stenobrocha 248]